MNILNYKFEKNGWDNCWLLLITQLRLNLSNDMINDLMVRTEIRDLSIMCRSFVITSNHIG